MSGDQPFFIVYCLDEAKLRVVRAHRSERLHDIPWPPGGLSNQRFNSTVIMAAAPSEV